MLLTWLIDTLIVTVNVDDDDDDEDVRCYVEIATAGGTADGFLLYYLRQRGYVFVELCLSVSNFAQKLPNRLA